MNYIKNDYGEWVIAIGAPGSMERVKIEYPKLIHDVSEIYFKSYNCYGHCCDEAIKLIRSHGIKSELVTNSIMANTPYNPNAWPKEED